MSPSVCYETFCQLAKFVCEWIENGHDIEPALRARLHAATRKVRMTDEDLKAMIGLLHRNRSVPLDDVVSMPPRPSDYLELLRDLRDRYEDIGKYAPAARETQQPPEEVPRG